MSTPDPNYQEPQPQQQYPPPPQPPYGVYPPYGYQYTPPRPTNGLAIAAMIMGIVGVCNPISILGLIFGMVSKRQIAERGEQGEGFATAGIVLGWIGVASVVFWAIYFIFIIGIFTTAVNEIDDWPTDFPTTDDPTWAIELIGALLA
ncbi:DUF4190 domain-containing protein [Glycomyces harbinensis]|uniref:DUF4190 domain-containing protein n=1 Tax=Glycomyces harbinensis TaxID=58114 RepID=A0A1G6SEN2_9ACTN|nr:DUF4190 domain-containing protein [Glycomyces harbinensis]SDD15114.1 protein of unknown function [Glycomyces harbinensis]